MVGGGDVAMEEALFLARYASKVYIVQRFPYLEASKIMARRAVSHPKIEVRGQLTQLHWLCIVRGRHTRNSRH